MVDNCNVPLFLWPLCLCFQIFQVDVKHVSPLLSYDHLWAMSDDQTVTTPQRIAKVPKADSALIHRHWVVEQVPFSFDVIGLLPKTRQVEMVFSSLIETLPQGICTGVSLTAYFLDTSASLSSEVCNTFQGSFLVSRRAPSVGSVNVWFY